MTIHEAILEVCKEVGYVQREGTVSFGTTKYKYAGEADLINALRPAMIKAGITFYCSGVDTVIDRIDNLVAKYTWTFSKGDSSINVVTLGQGADKGDKAAYKAATGALKYALRQTFLIETGDDPDQKSSEEQQVEEKERRKRYKESVTVEYKEGEDVYEWVSHVETYFHNADDPYQLKAVADANKVTMKTIEGIDKTPIEGLRNLYSTLASGMM